MIESFTQKGFSPLSTDAAKSDGESGAVERVSLPTIHDNAVEVSSRTMAIVYQLQELRAALMGPLNVATEVQDTKVQQAGSLQSLNSVQRSTLRNICIAECEIELLKDLLRTKP